MSRLALLLLVAAPLAAAPVPKAVTKKEPATLKGTWEVVDRQNDGKPIKFTGRELWVFDGSGFAIHNGVTDLTALTGPDRKPHRETMSIDPDDPTAITFQDGRNRDGARVQLDEDTLRIAIPLQNRDGRPAEAKPGRGVAYIEFKRVDEAKLKAK